MAQVDVNLRDLYRVIRKRKWIILFAPILMAVSAYFLVETPVPIYTANALIKITRSSSATGMMADIYQYGSYDNMATQIMVIRSRPVMESVARRLNMVQAGDNLDDIYDDLKGRVAAEQQNASDILSISATSDRSDKAIELANTVVAAYIDKYNEDRNKSVTEAFALLSRRTNEIREERNQAERDLFEFKRQQGAKLALNPNLAAEAQQKLVQYRRSIDNDNAILNSVSAMKETKDFDGLVQSFFILEDPVAKTMYDYSQQRATNVIELRNTRTQHLRTLTESNIQVKQVETQIAEKETTAITALNRLIERLRTNIKDTEKLIATSEEQQKLVEQQPELATQLDTLTLTLREKQELATGLRKQLQDAEIVQREKVEEVTIVEKSHSATTQTPPSRNYKALVAALIGILIGGVFSFVLEAMDTSLGTIEDVEQHISSVVLGIIPHLEKEDVKDRMRVDKGPTLSPEEMERFSRLVTHFDPKSIGSEAYRTLRTNVASIMAKGGGKVILLSSSMIQEGKTTSCCNLATAFAQGGKRTLLIDADLRRPTVDKTFGIVRVPGLSDLLLDTRDSRECFRTVDDIMLGKYGLKLAQATPGLEYLTILPAGRIVDKPTELLTSPALDKLLAEVREKFDVIIIDVSPILPVADAFVLAPKCDGVILAYQIGRVARDVLKRTKGRIESVGGKVWGVILNDIQSEIDYRSGDFSYYHYRYDRHLDEPKTVMDRLRAAIKLPPRDPSKARKPAKRKPPSSPPPPAAGSGGATASGANGRSGESGEVKDIMSLTDE